MDPVTQDGAVRPGDLGEDGLLDLAAEHLERSHAPIVRAPADTHRATWCPLRRESALVGALFAVYRAPRERVGAAEPARPSASGRTDAAGSGR
ncbi:hypothetical protein GCM10009657_31030 [Oryzihumus leptocrescens]